MGMFDAVVFDLDGTLVASEAAAHAVALAVFAEHGHPVTPEVLLSLVGHDEVDSERLLRAALGAEAPLDLLHGVVRQRVRAGFEADGVPLRPGARALVEQLAARGMPMAIATSSRSESAEWKLRRADLRTPFRVLVSLDDVVQAKPAPEPFLLAAARLGVDPARCLAFEDSDTGTRAARAAGMTVVQVPDLVPSAGQYASLLAPDLLAGARAVGLIAG